MGGGWTYASAIPGDFSIMEALPPFQLVDFNRYSSFPKFSLTKLCLLL
jgi:hypothetical protein